MEFIQFVGFHKFPSNTHTDSVHTGIGLVGFNRSFPVSVWTIDICNRFLYIISGVSCSYSVYTYIIHLLNLQMCGCGLVCAMLDLNLTNNNISMDQERSDECLYAGLRDHQSAALLAKYNKAPTRNKL